MHLDCDHLSLFDTIAYKHPVSDAALNVAALRRRSRCC
jgi:hypothetical protein